VHGKEFRQHSKKMYHGTTSSQKRLQSRNKSQKPTKKDDLGQKIRKEFPSTTLRKDSGDLILHLRTNVSFPKNKDSFIQTLL
jgi:hypothetical protein